jgi:hypothetical protein
MNRNVIIASFVIGVVVGFASVVALIIHHDDQGMENLGDGHGRPSAAPALHQDNEPVPLPRQETMQRAFGMEVVPVPQFKGAEKAPEPVPPPRRELKKGWE